MSKEGELFSIVGRMGEGKTPEIKNKYLPYFSLPFLINDLHNEYGHIKRSECVADVDLFIKRAYAVRNTCICADEMDTMFDGFNARDMANFIYAIQHNCNFWIGASHGWKETPDLFIKYSKWLLWFDTGESYETIKAKDKRLLRYYNVPKPVLINTKDKNQWGENLPML